MNEVNGETVKSVKQWEKRLIAVTKQNGWQIQNIPPELSA